MPDIIGITVSWLIAKGYFKKGSKEMVAMEKRLSEGNQKSLDNATEKLKKQYDKSVQRIEKSLHSMLKPIFQNLNPNMQTQIYNDIKELSTELSYIATGSVSSGGQAQYGYTPNILPMTKSVITDDGKSV